MKIRNLTIAVVCWSLPALSAQTPVTLELGKPVTAELAGGLTHVYTVTAQEGQFVRVNVLRPAFTTVVRIIRADGLMLPISVWRGAYMEPQTVCWIANASEYRITISTKDKNAKASKYEVKLVEVRDALPTDAKQLEGQKLIEQAQEQSTLLQHQKAIVLWEQALAIVSEAKDPIRVSIALRNLGSEQGASGNHQKAMDYFEQALAVRRQTRDRAGEAAALRDIGSSLENLKLFEKAISSYEQATVIYRDLKDRSAEASTIVRVSSIYRNLGKFDLAIDALGRALGINREINDRANEADVLLNMATLGAIVQNPNVANNAEQALLIFRELKDRKSEGVALIALVATNATAGRIDEAITSLEQALAIFRETKERSREASTLGWLADFHLGKSQFEKAILYLEQALPIARAVNDRKDVINALTNLAKAYMMLGDFEKALNYSDEALVVARSGGESIDRPNEVLALLSIGLANHALGNHKKTIASMEEALKIARDLGGPFKQFETILLLQLGIVYRDDGMPEKAIGYLEQAAAINMDGGLPFMNVLMKFILGSAYGQAGQNEKAIGYMEEILKSKMPIMEPAALAVMGEAYSGLGKHDQAAGYLARALAISRETSRPSNEAYTQAALMKVWNAQGNPRLAILYGKQAVNTVQNIRSNIQGLPPELQQSFLKANDKPYHALAELLIDQGRLAEAEQVLGLLKEQEFFEFVRRDLTNATADRSATLTTEEAEWSKRYDEIGNQLVGIGTERGVLNAKLTRTPEETGRLTKLEQDLAAGNRAFEKFLGELETHFSAKPEANLRMEQLRDTDGIKSDLRELPAGTVAIYTVVGASTYSAILVTPQVRKAFQYPISAVQLNKKIQEFREVVRDPNLDPRPLARELYKILLPNMADDLRQANAKTLMFSLDGTLRYLPLAALHDGEHYLVEQYRLSVFTPASNARLKDQPSASWKVAGFGVTKAHAGAPALPSVAAELNGIVMQKPRVGGVLEGEVMLDDKFTLASMRETLRKRYGVVHIASHFNFQPGNDDNSFLLLGDGGHYSLSQLRNSSDMFDGVQLLTLSACNTGVGDAPGDGKEVEGFGVQAQRKGAKAVIASLWPVADESTSLLMREFYRIRESEPGMPKVEALGRAQMQLLRGGVKAENGSERAFVQEAPSKTKPKAATFLAPGDAPYAHPYYWAPFFLMGNWL